MKKQALTREERANLLAKVKLKKARGDTLTRREERIVAYERVAYGAACRG